MSCAPQAVGQCGGDGEAEDGVSNVSGEDRTTEGPVDVVRALGAGEDRRR